MEPYLCFLIHLNGILHNEAQGLLYLNVIKWSVGRTRRKWEGNIKMDLRGIDCEVGRYSE
jgi:hypothetical protein